MVDLIASEVNVKEVELLEDASDILVKQIKPNFKVLGPRFGKDMKSVAQAISNLNAQDIKYFEQNNGLDIDISGKKITLERSDVEISSQDIEGWLVASADGFTVALDITLNDNLKNEGIARELVNRIQNLRKDSGLELTDRIDVSLQKDSNIISAIKENSAYIKEETLTNKLEIINELDSGIEIEFDDVYTKLLIKKV